MNIATSTNIFYERIDGSRIPVEQSIRACAAAGFRELDFGFVELAASSQRFHSSDWQSEILHFSELALETGVKFVQAHATIPDFCNPTTDYDEKLELFRRSVVGAGLLGVPWIVVHPSTLTENGRLSPKTHEKNIAFFREAAVLAKENGVGIAIENMWGKTLDGVPHYAVTDKELLRLIIDIERDNIGACWDVEHAGIENLSNGKAIRLLAGYLKATHISDETGENNIHILPYTGHIDWHEVLEALSEIGYKGVFAFEIQHYLPAMPLPIVPSAMKLAFEVGTHMVKQITAMKDLSLD